MLLIDNEHIESKHTNTGYTVMNTYTTEHLVALNTRLSNEKEYLALAKTTQEVELRTVWIKQIEKEIEHEVKFLESKGVNLYTSDTDMTDDELMAELLG